MRRQRKNKIILGLTGSFGSGKTTVAKWLRSFGAEVIDADKIVHQLICPGNLVYDRIIQLFGKGILKKNKAIDRAKLAGVVFGDKNLLVKLNKIIHPQVIRMIKDRIKGREAKVVVLDAPLLIEAGLKNYVDKLVVVKIKRKEQIARMQKKFGLSKEDILKRVKAQMNLGDKVRLADFVIDNSGTKEKTKSQIIKMRRLLWRN